MVRPRLFRRIGIDPDATYFKPRGIPLFRLEEEVLEIDELEAFRLVDGEGKAQVDAAEKMGISQPTLNRLLAGARKKVATAVSKGKAIRIKPSKA